MKSLRKIYRKLIIDSLEVAIYILSLIATVTSVLLKYILKINIYFMKKLKTLLEG